MMRPNATSRGFSLTEMLITVSVIGVATALVVPSMRDETRLRLLAAATVLASDLEAAQVMTIADPSNQEATNILNLAKAARAAADKQVSPES